MAHCIEVTNEGVAAVDRYNDHALEEKPEEDTKAHCDEYVGQQPRVRGRVRGRVAVRGQQGTL